MLQAMYVENWAKNATLFMDDPLPNDFFEEIPYQKLNGICQRTYQRNCKKKNAEVISREIADGFFNGIADEVSIEFSDSLM